MTAARPANMRTFPGVRFGNGIWLHKRANQTPDQRHENQIIIQDTCILLYTNAESLNNIMTKH